MLPPGASRSYVRAAPEFVDDPDGGGLFAHLRAATYRSPPVFVTAVSDARIIGYRTIIQNGQFFDDSTRTDEQTSKYLDAIASENAFLNEDTGLKRVGNGTGFSFSAGKEFKIEGTVLCLCSHEPSNYGSFIFRVLPKLAVARDLGLLHLPVLVYDGGASFRSLLSLCGVPPERIIRHAPHRTTRVERMICPSLRNPHAFLDPESRAFLGEIRDKVAPQGGEGRKIYISRLGHSRRGRSTRMMLNEEQLIAALANSGFEIIEPECLSSEQQIEVFASAGFIVGASGSALFNVPFCHPGTKLIDIESEPHWIYAHTGLFASCGLRYGIFEGRTDPEDPRPAHKRWTVNVEALMDRIATFLKA